jgi:glycosidase
VWPLELQHPDCYTRAGTGDLGKGHHGDEQAEHKRSDFLDLRDFHLEGTALLTDLALCYKYWIALTDCDGFRIDTLKHVTAEQARSFCGSIKEFAHRLGKRNFIMLGEVAGGEHIQDYYLDVLDLNLDAVLDIGEMRPTLSAVAKGIMSPEFYFNGFSAGDRGMGSHRNLGKRHVSILDDHDHVFSDRIRFSSETASPHQVVAGVALQMFTLGIPCVYYGTEQALAGPEPGERRWLPDWKQSDRYLREAMFGPVHPRKSGAEGLNQVDTELPGFGPFGTAGHHCFDADHPVYKRIAALTEARSRYPALRYGRQYLRAISFLGKPFSVYGPGELIAWSRILDDEELLCVLNANGLEDRGGYVSVDAAMNGKPSASFTVVLNTAEVAGGATSHPVGSTLAVHRTADGRAFVELMNLAPSEIVVLANYP